MARRCDITGKGTAFWNRRSHSMKASRRKFKVNIIKKRITLPNGKKVYIKIEPRLYKRMRGFVIGM